MPRPLAGLLGVVAVVGVCWAMLTPPWQSPDAFSHYSYLESLATRLSIPGRGGYPESSSSVQAADVGLGAHEIQWSSPEAKPVWNAAAASATRARSARLSRSDGGGLTPSATYPPLYYATALLAYYAGTGGDEFDRLNLVQLWGVVLLLATVIGAWLLAGEVFGRRPLLQLLTAAVAGLQPMSTFISTSVSPDALLLALWTFTLWAGCRVIKRGAVERDVTLLSALTAAGILTKQTGYALVPAVALAIWLGWRRRPDAERGGAARVLGRAVMVPALVVVGWLVIEQSLHHAALSTTPQTGALAQSPATFLLHFFDYLWQFYLPRLPGQELYQVPSLGLLPWPRQLFGLPLWNVWIREGWGVFGWVDVYMPGWIYGVLAAVTATVVFGVGAAIVRFRDRLRLSLVAYFGVVTLSLLAVLHVVEYQDLRSGLGPFIQGRYVLPLVSLFGLGAAVIVARLPLRARGPVVAVGVVSLLSLQIVALGTIATTYYT